MRSGISQKMKGSHQRLERIFFEDGDDICSRVRVILNEGLPPYLTAHLLCLSLLLLGRFILAGSFLQTEYLFNERTDISFFACKVVPK